MTNPSKSHFTHRSLRLARYNKALSHPARLEILVKLAKNKTCICGEIVAGLPLAQSTVSQHLKELKNAGLIQGRIDGLKSCYCINPAAIKDLLALSSSLFQVLANGSATRRNCK